MSAVETMGKPEGDRMKRQARSLRRRARGVWPWLASLLFGGLTGVSGGDPAPEAIEFFETRVRPTLIESCYPCHSAEAGKAKGGLRLDTRDAWLKGGDSGPALAPGDPEVSLLLKAVRYTDKEIQMPPASAGGKLAPERIADLEHWIRLGAPDPRVGSGQTALTARPDTAAARAHWAFQRVEKPALPGVQNAAWIRTPVDAFVLAKLEAKGLKPAPPVDRRSLVRRVHFDLTGLPPNPQAVDEFLADDSPDAYERLVERLLASPGYGERWGRYWLDVARYADTKGYVFQEERRYAFSHTYRDYVIQALNEDKPFDRFLLEQIAADRLIEEPAAEVPGGGAPAADPPRGDPEDSRVDRSSLAALGFLTLGRRFLNNQNDIIDDRIDVLMRGTQALTVGCARCHDHKFDPIPIQDYYALHGVFASSHEPVERPLLGTVRDQAAYADYLKQKADIEAKREAVIRSEVDKFLAEQRARMGDYLLAARDARRLAPDASLETFAGERKVTLAILRRWMAVPGDGRPTNNAVLEPWFALAALSETNFAEVSASVIASWTTTGASATGVNSLVVRALTGAPLGSISDVAGAYNRLSADTAKAWSTALDAARKAGGPLPGALADPDQEAIRLLLWAEDAPANLPETEVREVIARHLDNLTVTHRQQVEALQWTHPGVPLRAMALADQAQPRNSRVFIRGNPGNPGPEVPRRFLAVLAGPNPPLFTNGSGRLDLARAIASPDNPLTARVFVNRVWGWRFGAALVRTPSDFGVRTEPPVQRDLLDWLAATFIEQGWSVKQLHRVILRSNTYRQSSEADPGATLADPENQLLHHFPRRRLDFEALRDSLLAVSGRLDPTVGGLPVDILSAPFSPRRSVYGFIDRQNLPGLFRTFDFANPDASSPQRFATTVPQQALFLMNSPFVQEQARHLAGRPEVQSAPDAAAKLRTLCRLVYQREPEEDEARLAERYLAAAPEVETAPAATWERLAQVFLLTNEFAFVD